MLKLKYLMIFLLVGLAAAGGFWWTKKNLTGSGEKIKGTQAEVTSAPKQEPAPNYPKTLGDFLVTEREICLENGKPIVYFFGSSSCPHCVWEKPIAQKVFARFKDQIAYHENFDSDKDGDVFQKYSDINPGYVPFLVLGCKYIRVGAGENLGKDDAESQKLEEEALTAIICKLTGGKPGSVCDLVKDKTSEVK